MIKLSEDRHRNAVIESARIRAGQKIDQSIPSSDFIALALVFEANKYAVQIEVPIVLWPAMESTLDLAKHRAWGKTRRALSSCQRKLQKLLDEDPVTRLGRLGLPTPQ